MGLLGLVNPVGVCEKDDMKEVELGTGGVELSDCQESGYSGAGEEGGSVIVARISGI